MSDFPERGYWSIDRLGRHLAQLLANDGLTVGTYGVLADQVNVETPDGLQFVIDINLAAESD